MRVVIIGGGFAGLACARGLGDQPGIEVLLLDRSNHHLFQPLLYQVAMAGLSPAEIAAPIRGLLSRHNNVRVVQAAVQRIDADAKQVQSSRGTFPYDVLVVAAGAQHSYFGHAEWEQHAPGLKSLEQATEIRRRVLSAFEYAESEDDPELRRALLTFVVIGGGPTGVELAGALGEMSRYTLAKDFRNIDPKLTRIILIEAGPRILPSFSEALSAQATRDLERLGVQVWTQSRVSGVTAENVVVGEERIQARTTLWAAGVKASGLASGLGAVLDRQGRVPVTSKLHMETREDVYVVGDLAHCEDETGNALPGVATVALQQGRQVATNLLLRHAGKPQEVFRYWDKGQLATVGRSRALLQSRRLQMSGFPAWLAWLAVHIYYLSGFQNRLLVLIQWAWSYVSFSRGARLITSREWQRPS